MRNLNSTLIRSDETRAERYRGLRGFVIHAIPAVRECSYGVVRAMRSREVCGPVSRHWPYPGVCWWCHERVENRRARKWHTRCLRYFFAARGITAQLAPWGELCANGCGALGKQLDHHVAIGVAGRTSERELLRAFLPENLRWLCHACHAQKTGQDRREMNRLDGKPTREERIELSIEERVNHPGQLPGLVGFR